METALTIVLIIMVAIVIRKINLIQECIDVVGTIISEKE